MNFEKQDARLGLLVLVALGLFVGLVAYKNAGVVTERTYPLVVRFEQIEGLAPGADVQLKGYRVGSVEGVAMEQGKSQGAMRFRPDRRVVEKTYQ